MKLGFEEEQARYQSEPQNARALTESWLQASGFCPACGNASLAKFNNNAPVADFHCEECGEQYELKSQRGRFGSRIVDGAYKTMIERLKSPQNPNLFLLNYARTEGVSDLIVVPKQFFVPEIIEERKPLALSARRAGWIGCNILFSDIPEAGKIYIVRDKIPQPIEVVRRQWIDTLFLNNSDVRGRGWLLAVLKCVDLIGKEYFSLDEVYAQESHLKAIYPDNRHIKEKIRQQLQVLRDAGVIEFVRRGQYRKITY